MVMSGRSVNLTSLFLGRIRPRKRLTITKCAYFRLYLTTALLETVEEEEPISTKVSDRTGYRTRDFWLLSQTWFSHKFEWLEIPTRQCSFCMCHLLGFTYLKIIFGEKKYFICVYGKENMILKTSKSFPAADPRGKQIRDAYSV